jgi:dipeptidyl aminopeptidase/acylaminoacyl peptidase
MGSTRLRSDHAQHCRKHRLRPRIYRPYVQAITTHNSWRETLTTRAGIYRSWGGAPLKDLERLMDYLPNLPYLDWEKATIAGGSYGGYLISWMNSHPIIKSFACSIWHDGIFNLPTFLLATDYQTWMPDFNGPPYPWINNDDLEKWNPAKPSLLKNWKHAPPTLVIHSEKDYRCPMTEGLAVYKTLQGLGVPSRFLTFPDENHFVLKHENALVWNRTVFEWMERHAKNKVAGFADP